MPKINIKDAWSDEDLDTFLEDLKEQEEKERKQKRIKEGNKHLARVAWRLVTLGKWSAFDYIHYCRKLNIESI